jgi:hypothetical protein
MQGKNDKEIVNTMKEDDGNKEQKEESKTE